MARTQQRNSGQHAHRNRGNGGGHQGSGGHQGGGGGGGHDVASRLASALNPRQVASGDDLTRLAHALTRAEVKPQIRAYKRLRRELIGQQAADQLGLQRLGNVAERHISSAYSGFDQGAQGATTRAAAIGQMLNDQTGQLGQQAADQQTASATGELGGLSEAMSLRGAPGGGQAQQALQDMVNAQAGRVASDNQASGQFAATIGANYAGMGEGIREAGALQGTTALSDTARQIAARQAESRLTSGQDIREASGKLADVRALRGETLLKNLTDLREQERSYLLGRAATRTQKRGQDLTAASSAASLAERQANDQRQNQIAQQQANTAAQNATTHAQDVAHDNAHPNQGSGSRPHNATARHAQHQQHQQHVRDVKDAAAAARSIGSGYLDTPERITGNVNAFAAQIKAQTGVDFRTALNAAEAFIRNHNL